MQGKDLRNQFSQLKTKRQNWESHWQEVADYCLPRRADVTLTRSRGDKRTERIFDGTALHSLELLSSSLHGMLTNAATPWFSMRFKDEMISGQEANKEWLESCTDTMYMALDRSNFQQEIHELYTDMVAFGTGCMMIEEDEKDFVRFSTRHIKEIYIQENNKGKVDTIHRELKMTARAAYQQFKDKLPKRIMKIAQSSPHDDVTIYHCVKPNDDL
ncbi:MAG: portal protein, partial [Candidatus Actinomarinaceae bacterium]